MHQRNKKLTKYLAQIDNKYTWIIPFLVGTLACCTLVYAVWCGLGLTYDSHNYLSAARAIAEGRPMETQLGAKYVAQPPLFPAILSLWNGNLSFSKVFNIVCYAVTLILIWKLIDIVLCSFSYKVLACFYIFLSTPLLLVHSFLWSEPFFLVLIQLIIVTLYFHGETKSVYLFYALILLSLLLCAQRNAGVFIVSSIFLTFFLEESSFVNRIKIGIAFLTSSSGFFLWNLYGFSREGGGFLDAGYLQNVGGNILEYSSAIGVWFVPGTSSHYVVVAAGILSLWFVISIFFSSEPISPRLTFLRQLSTIPVVYVLGFVILGKPVASDAERFLAGIFPVYSVVVFQAIERMQIKGKKWLILPVAIILLYGLLRTGNNAKRWNESNCENPISLSGNNFCMVP
tara:strand:- start:2242 stop:3438 length:1197 start_codon:yes stop_codon:yes gene_type:complete